MARRHATRLLLLLLLALGSPALGEIYRCVDREGKTRYTSHADGCPGATPHVPQGRLQRVAPPRRSAPARRPPPAASAGADELQAAQWRAKRRAAEQEQAELVEDVDSWRQLVKSCNQGATLYVKDSELGLKRSYRCEDARARYEESKQRIQELDAYLSRGLAEECRRAGCLPGWIR